MKAVFFDVDGTLIEGTHPEYRYIRPKVEEAIRKLQAQGHYVFIASGRSYAFLDEKIRNFGFDGYVLLNGAVIYFHDKIIYRAPLNKDFVQKLCYNCNTHNMEYTLQGEKEAYVNKNFSYLMSRLAKYGIHEDQLCLDFDFNDINIYKLEIDSPHHSDRKYVIESLPEDINYVEDMNHNYCHVEVYAKANSKATGALKVLELLNIDIKDSFAFGDGDNYVEILSEIGFGMAMANGSVKARTAAKVTVLSVFEDGVAYGIEKYILDK